MLFTVIFVNGAKVTSHLKQTIKEAKSLVLDVNKVDMISISRWDGSNLVQINRFPRNKTLESGWQINEICSSPENKAKNEKLLKKFKKSAYLK